MHALRISCNFRILWAPTHSIRLLMAFSKCTHLPTSLFWHHGLLSSSCKPVNEHQRQAGKQQAAHFNFRTASEPRSLDLTTMYFVLKYPAAHTAINVNISAVFWYMDIRSIRLKQAVESVDNRRTRNHWSRTLVYTLEHLM